MEFICSLLYSLIQWVFIALWFSYGKQKVLVHLFIRTSWQSIACFEVVPAGFDLFNIAPIVPASFPLPFIF